MLTRTLTEHQIQRRNSRGEEQTAQRRNAAGQGVPACRSEKGHVEKCQLTENLWVR